jgi:hypothetical protein
MSGLVQKVHLRGPKKFPAKQETSQGGSENKNYAELKDKLTRVEFFLVWWV